MLLKDNTRETRIIQKSRQELKPICRTTVKSKREQKEPKKQNTSKPWNYDTPTPYNKNKSLYFCSAEEIIHLVKSKHHVLSCKPSSMVEPAHTNVYGHFLRSLLILCFAMWSTSNRVQFTSLPGFSISREA